eukprot:3680472-Pyramimonas_sp.AAC.1
MSHPAAGHPSVVDRTRICGRNPRRAPRVHDVECPRKPASQHVDWQQKAPPEQLARETVLGHWEEGLLMAIA